MLSGAGRHFDGHHGGAAVGAADLQPSVYGPHPACESGQAAAVVQAGVSCAVVGDAEPQQSGQLNSLDRGVPGAAVLGHVGQ